MGTHTWPCSRCGQEQKLEAPNGAVIPLTLCAACQEAIQREVEENREVRDSKNARSSR